MTTSLSADSYSTLHIESPDKEVVMSVVFKLPGSSLVYFDSENKGRGALNILDNKGKIHRIVKEG
jgi:hypothetical protein